MTGLKYQSAPGVWDGLPVMGAPGKTGIGVPPGGFQGDLLMPESASDYKAKWGYLPAGRVYTLDNGAALAATTWVALPWDTREYDTGGITNIAATTRMYAPISGLYEVWSHAVVTYQANNRLAMRIMKNDAVYAERCSAVAVNNCAISIAADVPMNRGDNIYTSIYTNVASTLVATTTYYNKCEMRWVAPL